jgi:DNA helicase-2/ATP-dependent DNA helicase PcrA
MEEDLFPHVNARESPQQLEEERRLCYVGMTRAKDHLLLSAAKNRYLWGTPRIMRPSRFLSEIPDEYIEKLNRARQEDSFVTEEEALPRGARVEHRDFGVGVVQKCYHTSLGLTYDVLFLESGIERTLVAKYAKLKLYSHSQFD